MIQQWLRFTLLLVFVSGSVGCELLEKPLTSGNQLQSSGRPPQTGTNIPRGITDKPQTSEKTTKKTKPKSTPTPTPKEKKKAQEEADEDFVTRGGFR